MKDLRLKSMLTIRGDSLYCPLAFSLDTYGNCLVDCWHCYLRRLNYVWGSELKPMDVEEFRRKLVNGLKNSHPRTSLAFALKQKKTLRFGNKADPFQPAERKWRVSYEALQILSKLQWSAVLQTRFSEMFFEYEEILQQGRTLFTLMPVMSPGLERDWELFERSRTTKPKERLRCAAFFIGKGFNVGFNGEPFIPGFHTVKDFEDVLKLLKQFRIPSYNTYNFHWNGFVARRLLDLGVDIERIWFYNQDSEWAKILPQLIDLAKRYDIDLGCPDFVNSGAYVQRANTCCGVEVSNPCRFNVIEWKRQQGRSKNSVLEASWDGIGDYALGRKVMFGETEELFTMKDVEKVKEKGLGL